MTILFPESQKRPKKTIGRRARTRAHVATKRRPHKSSEKILVATVSVDAASTTESPIRYRAHSFFFIILGVIVSFLIFSGVSIALASITFDNASIIGNATSTIDIGSSALQLQTLNNGPIMTGKGQFTLGGNLVTAGNVAASTMLVGLATSDPTILFNATADATSSGTPMSAAHFLTYVDNSGVFGNTGAYSSVIIRQPGGIGYGISSISQDATDGSGYVHNVGSNFQVWNSRAPDTHGSDVFGTAVGLSLGGTYGNPWPGAGVRVEAGGGPTNSGQIATAYDMTDGITPRILYARPSCTGQSGQMTCNSADIEFNGYDAGVYSPTAKIYTDFLGNLRFVSRAGVMVDAVDGDNASSSSNIPSAQLELNAAAWNGSASYGLTWNMFHNVNGPGTVTADHLEIIPPTNLPSGVIPLVAIDPYATATSSVNYGSPSFALSGSIWNGSAATNDSWSEGVVEGSGSNPASGLQFTHTGSTGPLFVNFPANTALQINSQQFIDGALNISGASLRDYAMTTAGVVTNSSSGVLGTTTAIPTVYNASGSLVSGVKIVQDSVQLSSGYATVTWTGNSVFTAIPRCFLSDGTNGTSTPGMAAGTLTTKGFTAQGNANDWVNYLCIGN